MSGVVPGHHECPAHIRQLHTALILQVPVPVAATPQLGAGTAAAEAGGEVQQEEEEEGYSSSSSQKNIKMSGEVRCSSNSGSSRSAGGDVHHNHIAGGSC